jgi:uncharacterized protein YjiS (DUF1127 family)
MAAPPRASARIVGLNILFRWVLAVEAWAENRRQRRALVALSDRMMKDIGLTRSEAEGIADANGGAAGPVTRVQDGRSSRRG